MSGRGSNTRGGRGSGRGGGGARAANEKGGRGHSNPGGGGRSFNSAPPLKGIGRGITAVKLYEIPQSAKDELLALDKERDKIRELQFENGLKAETEKKKLKDLEGSEILLQREITKLEHQNSKSTPPNKIDDSKYVETILKKHKDEYNALLNDKKAIKKTLEDLEKEEATLKQRIEAHKSKLEKKKEDLAKERLKYSQRQIDNKSKNQKAATENPAKVDTTPSIHPCQQEIENCDKLLRTLRGKTGEKQKKPQNEKEKVQPQEEKVEEEPKFDDDQPLSFNWTQLVSFEKISSTVPKTIGEAKALIPIILDRKFYFYNLGVPPEKRKKKSEKNGKNEQGPDVEEEGDLPADAWVAEVLDADQELDAGVLDVEQDPTEEPTEDIEEDQAEEETAVDETVADETFVDETVDEEPVIDETVDEEPVGDETVADEHAVDETVDEEQIVDETVVGETAEEDQEVIADEEAVDEDALEDGEHPTKEDETDEQDVEGFTMLGGDDDDV